MVKPGLEYKSVSGFSFGSATQSTRMIRPFKIPIDRVGNKVIRIDKIVLSVVELVGTNAAIHRAGISWEDMESVNEAFLTAEQPRNVLGSVFGSVTVEAILRSAAGNGFGVADRVVIEEAGIYCVNSPSLVWEMGESAASPGTLVHALIGFKRVTVTEDEMEALLVAQRPQRSK